MVPLKCKPQILATSSTATFFEGVTNIEKRDCIIDWFLSGSRVLCTSHARGLLNF